MVFYLIVRLHIYIRIKLQHIFHIYIHIGSLIDDADDAAGGDCNNCI